MRIHVTLFGPLRDCLAQPRRGVAASGGRAVVELPEGATVDDLCVRLGVESLPTVILIGDQQAHRGVKLKAGDRVTILSPLAGG